MATSRHRGGGKKGRGGRAVTIHDVARLAGVSIKTVSRVLNHEPHVRPRTQAKVHEAVAALGYRPHPSARSLAGQRSFLIGLPFANPNPHYLVAVERGALSACERLGYGIALIACESDTGDLADHLIAFARQSRLDGFLLFPPIGDRVRLLDALTAAGLPVARLAPYDDRRVGPAVAIDDRAAAAEMTAHLIGLGHRRIAFVRGHPEHGASHVREAGFHEAMRAAGLAVQENLMVTGAFTFESGIAAAERLLSNSPAPTAIFASNDEMAAGVLYAAHRRGLVVPRDLSVAGFDDSPLASQIWPRLTSVRQPVHEMAEAATTLLIESLRRSQRHGAPAATPPLLSFSAELVIRESTGPAP
ncbi:MAG: LacI family DNA-binding transcriptional regulator [Alphaproteobacteria bacterium]|nr:MAG: LacI family DNA-binding transcriptional regulator [Alphaproteobacteria bacterium]